VVCKYYKLLYYNLNCDVMRAIGVIGFKKSGKTTIIREILKKLMDKNVKVATIKHSFENAEIDKKDTDSYLFKEYAEVSVLSTDDKTAFYYNGMSLHEILSKLELEYEYVIIEGFKEQLKELNIPKIAMIKDDEGLELVDSHTILAINDYQYDIDEIMQLVAEKSIIPSYNLNCGHCGFNCKLFVEEVIKNNIKWNACVMQSGVKLNVNGKTIPMNPFVANIIKNVLKGVVESLKDTGAPKNISISIADIDKVK
jgi:molybdopterin-guanine dinucleotide biosynthesis protein B